LVTTTSAWPAPRAGVVAVIEVALATETPDAATPPIDTDAPAVNPEPVMLTVWPPAVVPTPGEIAPTVGAAAGGGDWGDGPAGLDDPPQPILATLSAASTAHAA
jgi:hypothetical protein